MGKNSMVSWLKRLVIRGPLDGVFATDSPPRRPDLVLIRICCPPQSDQKMSLGANNEK